MRVSSNAFEEGGWIPKRYTGRGEVVFELSGAIQGIAYGRHCYRGPKPPLKTTHNYTFTVYALRDLIDLPAASTKKEVLKQASNLILDQASLTGKFQSHRKESNQA